MSEIMDAYGKLNAAWTEAEEILSQAHCPWEAVVPMLIDDEEMDLVWAKVSNRWRICIGYRSGTDGPKLVPVAECKLCDRIAGMKLFISLKAEVERLAAKATEDINKSLGDFQAILDATKAAWPKKDSEPEPEKPAKPGDPGTEHYIHEGVHNRPEPWYGTSPGD